MIAVISMIVAGVAARIGIYLRDLPVNHDEGLLYLALQRWTPEKWLTPLPFEQTAAPLYLGILHILSAAGPRTEYALRLVALVASLLALPIFYLSVRVLRPGSVALIATALLALHSGLIIYAGFFKQYEMDVLATALVFGLAALIKNEYPGPATWWIVLFTGCVSLLVSQPAIITLVCMLVWAFLLPDRRSARRQIVFCGFVWIALEGILYAKLYAAVAASPYMRLFWADSYIHLGDIRSWWKVAQVLFQDGLGSTVPGLALTLLGIAVLLVRREKSSFILAAAPILSAISLAVLRLYPVAPRLWMFLSPPAALISAIGIESIGAALGRLMSGSYHAATAKMSAPITLAAVLLLPTRMQFMNSVFPALPALRSTNTADKVRGAVRSMLADTSCEPVYVAARSAPSWYFYTSSETRNANERYGLLQFSMEWDSPGFGDASAAQLHLPDLAPQFNIQIGCRQEVYGLASGTPNHNDVWPEGTVPVAGWAQNEVNRISATGRSDFFLYLDATGPAEGESLLKELSNRHFRYWTPFSSFRVYQARKD
jgi:hypothetical protein